MGRMPKKKSRRIVVDGRAFRWRLRAPAQDREDWMTSPPRRQASTMALQAESPAPGRVCRLSVSWRDDVPVTPEAVAMIVRKCISAGWDPDSPGVPFDAPGVDVLELPTRPNVVRDVMEA